jgi:phosphate uptake regulator
MRRKLIKHGESSLTVALPISWIKENGLVKGEEVEIENHSGKLVISTKAHYEKKKIDLDITNSKIMLKRIIGAGFKSGYDEIIINFSSHDELKQIQKLVREQFSGFEIINQSKSSITIKNLSEANFQEFPNVLRRFFLVLNQISEETAQAIEKDDFEWMKNITLLKIESDKFADYLRRAINMGFQTTLKRTPPLYTIIEQLEKTADRYTDLCEYILTNEIKINKNLKNFINELFVFEQLFYSLFYKFDLKKINGFGIKKLELQETLEKIELNSTKKEIKIITLCDRILNLIFDLNGPLIAVNI